MGICESENNLSTKEENKANTQSIVPNKSNKNEIFEKNEKVLLNQENKINNDRIPEVLIKFSPFEKLDNKITNVSKSICKLKIENILPNGIQTIFGTGFLLKFGIDLEPFYCLISNEHVITKNIINNSNNNILIKYDSEFKIANIKLDKNIRYIKSFENIPLDITCVEIIEEDNINRDFFLWNEPEAFVKNADLIKSNIYIPQYAQGKELVNARGSIININKYEFTHLVSTEHGSSGSPVFLENSIDVLGIHKQGSKSKSQNYGDFIYPIFEIIKKDIIKKRNKGKYLNGKYIWDDGKYYLGEFKNNIPNGKGIKYYKNGKIQYEGNFINGKFEGNGKFIYDDGYYYIGQFKDGLRNGKGTIYYPNGNIELEGNFINNKAEGNGKYIWEDGEYYIGQWRNGLSHGKGIEYYSNGKIKYEGEYLNDQREGNGKYMTEDFYFIGQYKKGKPIKGKLYSSNRKILLYDGIFINGEPPNGIKIYKLNDGGYYVGQAKDNLFHGKGIMYNSDGTIKQKGNWINNEFVGN